MKNCNIETRQTTLGIRHLVGIASLGLALIVAAPRPAHAQRRVEPPSVPDQIKVEDGNRVFFVGHGVGTQNYVCLPSGTGVAYQLFTPEATLLTREGRQLTTHFFSPNLNPTPGLDPAELNTIRATWQDSRDTSRVWARITGSATSTTNPTVVAQGAIAWLRLEVVGTLAGPAHGDELTRTTFIQRLNTVGGVAPSTGCASPADIGTEAFMPYRADYFFYTSDVR